MSTHTHHPAMAWVYRIAIVLILFTGFSNMPITKRYYIADLPGLGWTGNFLLNVQVHYMLGALLLALTCYFALGYLLGRRRRPAKLGVSGKLRALFLALALLSGITMALKNLPGINFPHPYLMAMDLAHLFSAVLFMLASLAALVTRRPWLMAKIKK